MRLLVVLVFLSASTSSASAMGVSTRERLTCSIAAALKFRLPPELMLAIAEIEGGKPGQWVRNTNGSHDVGPMQFNTKYLAHLSRRYGITAEDIAASGCYAYELAAWRLRRHLDRDRGDVWTRAANYHSRSALHNAKYRRKLIARASTWRSWLRKHSGLKAESGKSTNAAAGRERRRDDQPRDDGAINAIDEDERALLDELELVSAVTNSVSRGTPQKGALEGGTKVPPHRGYKVRDPNRAWGTRQAVAWLTAAFDALRVVDPTAPRVQIHDMSLRQGGVMGGHRSHQSGRDVDITYFRRACRKSCGMRTLKPHELDATRQWQLLSHWLKRDQLELAFVEYALQKPLFEAAERDGATHAQLARWFQYPRGATVAAGVVRHVPNHSNHVHVRFRCSAADSGCSGRFAHSARAENEKSTDEAEMLELLE